MSAPDRQRLLSALAKLAHREAELSKRVMTFLPLPAHRAALRPEIVVIRGERGAGKSALFGVIDELRDSAKLRVLLDDPSIPEARWVDGFSEMRLDHPASSVVDKFAKEHSEQAVRAFWLAHMVRRIREVVPDVVKLPEPLEAAWHDDPDRPFDWMPAAEAQLPHLAVTLDAIERTLEQRQQTVFVVYDHLDRLGAFDRHVRRRCISTLLALWLSLANRYRWLRAKIFIREDLFDPDTLAFPDASKLRPRSVALEWDAESLYRALVRHMAADDGLRKWLEKVREVRLDESDGFGWMPREMNAEARESLVGDLVGPVIGDGLTKAFTIDWIENRLKDAHGRIVPRSLLCLFGFAADRASKRDGEMVPLVAEQSLVEAVLETARERLGEIKEEYPIVRRLENLAGRSAPIKRRDAEVLLARPVEAEDEGLPRDGQLVLDALVRLGVLGMRGGAIIDVPDIYLLAQGIRRAGGTSVVRPDEELSTPFILLEQGRAFHRRARTSHGQTAVRLYEQAIAHFREALATDPALLEVRRILAAALFERSWYAKVESQISLCSEAIEQLRTLEEPRDAWTLSVLALARRRQANVSEHGALPLLEEAMAAATKAVELEPGESDYWTQRADIQLLHEARAHDAALLERARRDLQEALRLRPDSEVARITSAECWMARASRWTESEEQDLNEALAEMHLALRIAPDDEWAPVIAAAIALRQSRRAAPAEAERLRAAARERLESAVNREPEHHAARAQLAYLDFVEIIATGNSRPAQLAQLEAILRSAAEYVPVAAVYPLACVYTRLGDSAKAQRQLEASRSFGTLPPEHIQEADGVLQRRE